MKVYVISDLEGVAGVVDHRKQCWYDGRYYDQARRLATLELNALVEGAFAGGARDVVAWDAHGQFPGAIDVELLHADARLVTGPTEAGPVGLDMSCSALFFHGLHAMAGTAWSVLSYTHFPHLAGCWVNGVKVGEIGIYAALAGTFGVPAVFISGDRAAVEEAQALIPDIEPVTVKEGLSRHAAGLAVAPVVTLAPEKARTLIRDGARRAMERSSTIRPLSVELPFVYRVQFTDKRTADEKAALPGVRRIDTNTVEAEGTDLIRLAL